ncbi:hypothetical protein [Streptomyces sp. STR69]|uniref:hypothetical protein n=1 Tax=Streptomyces sp. STR69 TaxID=1796942 RepID=UPI0021C8C173|nr:hypothetical protein [Streptomyces sp. STR69]
MFQGLAHRAERVIVSRVRNDNVQVVDPMASARRIVIDEVSYREGHRHLTLGPDRSQQLTHVSTDVAEPSHVVFWATATLAGARHQVWNPARRTPADSALVESANTSIRLITGMAFDFRHHDNLIALVLLPLGGQRPALLGRSCKPYIRREAIGYGLL